MLPLQMLASLDPEQADAEEAEASGAPLLASRHAVWNEHVRAKAVEGTNKAERACALIMQIEEKYRGPKRPRSEEGLLWEKYLCAEMQAEHQRLKPSQGGQRGGQKARAGK